MAESQQILKWRIPAEYQRHRMKCRVPQYRKEMTRVLLRVGLPMCLLCVGVMVWLMGYLPPTEQRFLLCALLSLPLIIALVVYLPVLLTLASQYDTVNARLKPGGFVFDSNWCPWKTVSWYRFRDVESFPHLRMLELSVIGWRGREQSFELVFDPSTTAEQGIAEYMSDVLPGKESKQ